jgi:hypothetical protein
MKTTRGSARNGLTSLLAQQPTFRGQFAETSMHKPPNAIESLRNLTAASKLPTGLVAFNVSHGANYWFGLQRLGLFGLVGWVHPFGLLGLFMFVKPVGLFGLVGWVHPFGLLGLLMLLGGPNWAIAGDISIAIDAEAVSTVGRIRRRRSELRTLIYFASQVALKLLVLIMRSLKI